MPVHMPAEWAEQEWLWIGFPHDADLWLEDLVPVQVDERGLRGW